MADERERELVREAKEANTAEAFARAIRHLIRNGWDKIEAQREVCGVAEGDVLTWKHSGTGTVHLALCRTRDGDGYGGDVRRRHNCPTVHARAPCGAHGRAKANPEARRGWSTSEAFRLVEVPEVTWRQASEITCKTCRGHAWIFEDPEQQTFGWSLARVNTVRIFQKQARAWGLKLFECLTKTCPPNCKACGTSYSGVPCQTCSGSGLNPVLCPDDDPVTYYAISMGPDCEHGWNPARCQICSNCPTCKGWRRVWDGEPDRLDLFA